MFETHLSLCILCQQMEQCSSSQGSAISASRIGAFTCSQSVSVQISEIGQISVSQSRIGIGVSPCLSQRCSCSVQPPVFSLLGIRTSKVQRTFQTDDEQSNPNLALLYEEWMMMSSKIHLRQSCVGWCQERWPLAITKRLPLYLDYSPLSSLVSETFVIRQLCCGVPS